MKYRNIQVAKMTGAKILAGLLVFGLTFSIPATAWAAEGGLTDVTSNGSENGEKLQAKSIDGRDTLTEVSDLVLEMIQNEEIRYNEETGYLEDTGLREETLRHSISLYNRIITRLILNGVSVNTGLFYAVARLTGVVEGGVWNKETNSIYVVFNQGKELREEIAKTSVEILGEKSNVMYILETEDRKTKLRDGSATVRGAMLKVTGDNEAVGVSLTDSKGVVTKLEDDMIATNKPSELTLLIPSELVDGEYTLTITTQYTSGALLKSPRSASTTLWIGGKPTDGEDDRPVIE